MTASIGGGAVVELGAHHRGPRQVDRDLPVRVGVDYDPRAQRIEQTCDPGDGRRTLDQRAPAGAFYRLRSQSWNSASAGWAVRSHAARFQP